MNSHDESQQFVTRDELARVLNHIDRRFDNLDEGISDIKTILTRVDRRSMLIGQAVGLVQEELGIADE